MGEFEHIRVETAGGVTRITLARPPLNVLNIAMMREMNVAIERAAEDAEARALAFFGEGKAFSAGVDVGEHTGGTAVEMIEVFHGLFRGLLAFERPTVASVGGACLGGGCELATFCDVVIASERAKFGQPEVQVGVLPPVAAAWWPLMPGGRAALELMMNGRIIDAREAKEAGLVSRVVPAESLQEETEKVLTGFSKSSATVLRYLKRAATIDLRRRFETALAGIETLYLNELMKTHDANEGLAAFLEKRAPEWKHS